MSKQEELPLGVPRVEVPKVLIKKELGVPGRPKVPGSGQMFFDVGDYCDCRSSGERCGKPLQTIYRVRVRKGKIEDWCRECWLSELARQGKARG